MSPSSSDRILICCPAHHYLWHCGIGHYTCYNSSSIRIIVCTLKAKNHNWKLQLWGCMLPPKWWGAKNARQAIQREQSERYCAPFVSPFAFFAGLTPFAFFAGLTVLWSIFAWLGNGNRECRTLCRASYDSVHGRCSVGLETMPYGHTCDCYLFIWNTTSPTKCTQRELEFEETYNYKKNHV